MTITNNSLDTIEVEELLTDAVRRDDYYATKLLLEFIDKFKNEDEDSNVIVNVTVQSETKTKESVALELAARNGNYHIIKLFIARNYTIGNPHGLDCKCISCHTNRLGQSLRRIEILKAISNPIWIGLTSDNPFLTSFKLYQVSKKFGEQEDCFESKYNALLEGDQIFCSQLLDQIESEEEVRCIMKCGSNVELDLESNCWDLSFIRLAIKYNQKEVSRFFLSFSLP